MKRVIFIGYVIKGKVVFKVCCGNCRRFKHIIQS